MIVVLNWEVLTTRGGRYWTVNITHKIAPADPNIEVRANDAGEIE